MALTLLLLLEQANFDYQSNYSTEPYNQGFDSAVGQQGAQNFFGGGRRANLRSLELRSPAIHLIICNVPLPYTLSAEAVCPAILLAQQQQFRRSRESTYSGLGFESYMPYQVNQTRDQYHHDHGLDGPCVVVVKGLPVGILRAVRAIKNLVVNRLLLPQSG